ncbi:hypothetical protein Saro_1039 [Novosphingobium aromaticivorans DSM 12444]|uniref:Uncharacterized protein n=1 Tax=Novosphingobium aromaticivorans (strain ATCC 700278 / DSM 12444 / CCUG 56034 / CIP 105152 / NBRC 16084 / F199) TaxID=279238 RepID=Q2G9I9_NOVAD|nr:hypothetical protein [Novosphingobium aromaticivorans]ABD25484.1 hypothetical protein Saro_1039 [Novosphingobium aromaticivorans DSM 12444]SCX95053.1 hypothetical protein SAMN05660666_00370 [Novosphingobium aromaticivorans]
MAKKFFTKASPRAAAGIRRLYEGKGYTVRSMLQTDGTVTVVAMKDTDLEAMAERHSAYREGVSA